jgi:hypothetical protein
MHWLGAVQEPPAACRPHEPPTQVAGGVHCAFVVHVFTQVSVVASHRPGAQFAFAGVTHIPVPLHIAGGVRVDAVGQVAGAHCVPAAYRAHCPAAHWPVVPQVAIACAAHMPCGSGPLATLVHVPIDPFRLQAVQAAPQAVVQQTPWAQMLVAHSAPVEQEAPGGFNPQLLIMPFMPQKAGEMHSTLLAVHAVKHLVALQW